MCTPPSPPLFAAGGGLSLQKIFQKEGGGDLRRSQFLEGVARKEEGDFSGELQFLHKK